MLPLILLMMSRLGSSSNGASCSRKDLNSLSISTLRKGTFNGSNNQITSTQCFELEHLTLNKKQGPTSTSSTIPHGTKSMTIFRLNGTEKIVRNMNYWRKVGTAHTICIYTDRPHTCQPPIKGRASGHFEPRMWHEETGECVKAWVNVLPNNLDLIVLVTGSLCRSRNSAREKEGKRDTDRKTYIVYGWKWPVPWVLSWDTLSLRPPQTHAHMDNSSHAPENTWTIYRNKQ